MNSNLKVEKFLLLIYSYSGFDWEGLLVQKVVAPHVPDIKVRFMNNKYGLFFQVSKRKLFWIFVIQKFMNEDPEKTLDFFKKRLKVKQKNPWFLSWLFFEK